VYRRDPRSKFSVSCGRRSGDSVLSSRCRDRVDRSRHLLWRRPPGLGGVVHQRGRANSGLHHSASIVRRARCRGQHQASSCSTFPIFAHISCALGPYSDSCSRTPQTATALLVRSTVETHFSDLRMGHKSGGTRLYRSCGVFQKNPTAVVGSIAVLLVSIALMGCPADELQSDTDIADTTPLDVPVDGRLQCNVARCPERSTCLQDNGPAEHCEQPLGSCRLNAPVCPSHSDFSNGWRACACGVWAYPSVCRAWESGESSRLFLCRTDFDSGADPLERRQVLGWLN
jgi:hypothetical protein